MRAERRNGRVNQQVKRCPGYGQHEIDHVFSWGMLIDVLLDYKLFSPRPRALTDILDIKPLG